MGENMPIKTNHLDRSNSNESKTSYEFDKHKSWYKIDLEAEKTGFNQTLRKRRLKSAKGNTKAAIKPDCFRNRETALQILSVICFVLVLYLGYYVHGAFSGITESITKGINLYDLSSS